MRLDRTEEPEIELRSGARVTLAAVGLLESLRAAGWRLSIDEDGSLEVRHHSADLHPDVLHTIVALESEIVALLLEPPPTIH